MATLAAREGLVQEFTQAAYRTRAFVQKQDPGTPESPAQHPELTRPGRR